MRLSVFDKFSGKYRVYESDLNPIHTGDTQTGLGTVPSLAMLPGRNIRFMGSSDYAQGQIVEDPVRGMTIGKFVTFGLSLAVVYFLFQGIKKFNKD